VQRHHKGGGGGSGGGGGCRGGSRGGSRGGGGAVGEAKQVLTVGAEAVAQLACEQLVERGQLAQAGLPIQLTSAPSSPERREDGGRRAERERVAAVGRAELNAARAHASGAASLRSTQLGCDGLGKEQARAECVLLGDRCFVLRREGWPNHRRRDFTVVRYVFLFGRQRGWGHLRAAPHASRSARKFACYM
jgi:hypothetical protein